MKQNFFKAVIISLLLFIPLISFSKDNKHNLDTDYYNGVKSFLSKKKLEVRPRNSERDVNLIDPEKGAAGVLFGASISEVVRLWGKPYSLNTDWSNDTWSIKMGALRFDFFENELVKIGIHNVTLKNAYFENGVNFKSSLGDVMSAFGKPINEREFFPKFLTKNGYVISFHFHATSSKPELLAVSIAHPDFG